jgi:hypothetical protein
VADKIQIEIEVSGDGEVKFKNLTAAAEDFGNRSEKALGKATSAFDVFSGVLSADAVEGAFKSLIELGAQFFEHTLVEGVKQAIAQEDAINRLNQALAVTGQYSQETSARLQAFAQGLQKTTKYSDDEILSAQSLLLSLTKLNEAGLKSATKGALDLSAGLGIDLNSAATDVAKAIDGQAGVLGRYGLHLVDGASKADNLARVLQFLNARFGGDAEAQINTFSGSLAVFQHAMEDGQKATGAAIITNQSLINVLKAATEIISQFNDGSKESKQRLSAFVSDGVILAIDALAELVHAVEFGTASFLKLENAARGIDVTFQILRSAWSDDAQKRFYEIADAFEKTEKEITKLEGKDSVFNQLSASVQKLRDAAVAGVGKIADTSNLTERSLKNAAAATDELTAAQKRLGDQGKQIAQEEARKDPLIEAAEKQKSIDAARQLNLISAQEYADAEIQIEADKQNKISDLNFKQVEVIITRNQALMAQGTRDANAEVLVNQQKLAKILTDVNLNANAKAKVEEAYSRTSKEIEKNRSQAVSDSLNALATLQNAKTKEIAIVGKAAAIAQTTIDTYSGAQKAANALAGIPVVGPALAVAAAAAFVAAGLFRVATIAGVQLATGITEVPAGYPNDSFPARLTSGERVVDAGTNQDLKAFLAASRPMLAAMQAIVAGGGSGRPVQFVVQIGTKTIVDEVITGLQQGRTLSV